MTLPLALGMPGPLELGFLLMIGLLFFGKRLPEVGKSIGQTVVQFKKGLADMENDIHSSSSTPTTPASTIVPQIEVRPTEVRPALDPSEFKFDPHTGKPIERVS